MYQVDNPMDKAMGFMGQASGSFASMMPNIPANQDPGPTAGGALGAGLGGAVTGAALGSTNALAGTMMAGPAGVAIGAGVGILSYLFS